MPNDISFKTGRIVLRLLFLESAFFTIPDSETYFILMVLSPRTQRTWLIKFLNNYDQSFKRDDLVLPHDTNSNFLH